MDEQDIPIEIAAIKLLEWLESRKIIQKNWQIKVRDVRNKISSALNDMPVHQNLVKLLSGAYINYFHCLQIIEILKTTEADTKSLFGRYGSQRMTDWQQIAKAYEKESMYLAEAASILQRHNVEVPGLRKQRNKIGQLIDETRQRIRDLQKTEETLYAEKNAMCEKLEIKGVNLKEEFIARIKVLPSMYEVTVKQLQKLEKSIAYYLDFSGCAENLPILRHILKHGNTTVYQFMYNEAPLSIEESQITVKLTVANTIAQNQHNNDAGTIDFGVDSGEIDFGGDAINFDNICENTLEAGNIDWGEIDMNCSLDNTDISLEESGIIVAESGMDGGVARGLEALTLLDSSIHRDQFFDELYELQAFLQMRQYDFKSDQANSFVFYLIDGNGKYDLDTVTKMLDDIAEVLEYAASDTIDHLYRLKHSPTYADIIAAKLQHQLQAVEKSKATRVILTEKLQKLNVDKENIKPEINKLIESSKQLQKQIELDISKRYKGRNVILYGGVDFESSDK